MCKDFLNQLINQITHVCSTLLESLKTLSQSRQYKAFKGLNERMKIMIPSTKIPDMPGMTTVMLMLNAQMANVEAKSKSDMATWQNRSKEPYKKILPHN